MATKLKGIDGKVVVSGSTLGVTAWTINANQNLVDVTEIGDNARQYFPTIKDASGSLTFNLKSNEDRQNALLSQFKSSVASTAVAIELHFSTSSDKIAGSAFLSGFDAPGAVEGVFPITANFQMTGGITSVPTSTST